MLTPSLSPNQRVEDADPDVVLKSGPSTPRNIHSPVSRPLSANDQKFKQGSSELDVLEYQNVEAGDDEEEDDVPVSMIVGEDETDEDSWQNEKETDGNQEDGLNVRGKDENSGDSDSQDQKLQYDFTSGILRVPDEANDSDDTVDECAGEEDERDSGDKDQLKPSPNPTCAGEPHHETSSMFGNVSSDEGPSEPDEDDPAPEHSEAAPITDIDVPEPESGTAPQTSGLLDSFEEEPEKDDEPLRTPTTGQGYVSGVLEPDGSDVSDEEIPQTDIDDVDVDSPVENEVDHLIKGLRCLLHR